MANIKGFEFAIGADPEVFVKNKTTQKLVSAHDLIPGTKDLPYDVDDGSVQVDGMALEFNIKPATNAEQFDANIKSVMATLSKMVPDHEFEITPVAEFGADYIRKQPEVAKRLGCMPDYNAYTKTINPVPNGNTGFRTASGHVHIGWRDPNNKNWDPNLDPMEPSHFEACCQAVKALDVYLGVPSISLRPYWDSDAKRRKLYGLAGSFRPKNYGNGWLGVEYRVLSNSWLKYPWLTKLIFNNTIEAFEQLFEDYDFVDKVGGKYSVRDIVNNVDKDEYRDEGSRIIGSRKIKTSKYYRELYEKAA